MMMDFTDGMRAWNGFIWLRIETSDRILWTRCWTFWSP